MHLSLLLLSLSGFFYAAALIFHCLAFAEIREEGHQKAAGLLKIGFFFSSLALLAEALRIHWLLPVSDFSGALAFFAWSLAFVYLVLLAPFQSQSFGLVLNPLLLILIGLSIFQGLSRAPQAEPAVLKNVYFSSHIAAAFFAYASFTLSFAASILFLVQRRQLKRKQAGPFYHQLPSLEELERLIFQPLYWGAPLLIISMAMGFIGSKWAFGQYWLTDPKTLMTGAVSVAYFMILILRKRGMFSGRKVAVSSILAFSLMIVGFVGLRFCEASHHYF